MNFLQRPIDKDLSQQQTLDIIGEQLLVMQVCYESLIHDFWPVIDGENVGDDQAGFTGTNVSSIVEMVLTRLANRNGVN